MKAKIVRNLAMTAAGAGVLMMAACASTPDTSAPKPHITPHIPEPAPMQVPSTPAPITPQTALKPMADDQCGAQALQYLVGKPRTDIPVPLYPSTRRVVCSTCVVTQEYRANRQTITFNSDTGLITSVKCG